jgi:predicted nuclease of predicted toxin-antitoxin system
MKLLLDENLPRKLKQDLLEFEVHTVSEIGWSGKKNGELMSLMVEFDFSALITFDKNLQYQQNFKKYSLAVLVLSAKDNTYNTLTKLIPKLKQRISKGLESGPIEIKV